MKVITTVSKALVILSFAVVLAVVLAGCGSDDPTTAPVRTTATPFQLSLRLPL